MKIKSLFMSMAAALVFVGCSDNNADEPQNTGGTPADGETGYVAVSIVQPKSAGSRATGDFENGSAAENEAKEGLFFILDADGNVQTTDGLAAQRVTLSGNGTHETPAVEHIYSAILLINGVSTDPTGQAKQIVCVLNAPAGLETGVNNLQDLQDKIEDYCTGKTSSGTFVMSNSVYKDSEGKLVIGTTVDPSKIKTSAGAALADPVEIYVERVVAKVRAAKKAGGMAINDVEIDVDGTKTTYKINIDGIALANLTDKARLIKDINGYSSSSWTWNDPANFRSFWEIMPSAGVSVKKVSWNNIDLEANYDASAADGTTCFEQYILPHTFSADNTAIVIAAHLTKKDTGETADLVWIRGGYTTDAGALNIIATAIQSKFSYYKKVSDTQYTTIAPADFEWKEAANGSCYAVLKGTFGTDNKIYTFTAPSTFTEVTDGVKNVNDYLADKNANHLYAYKYTGGKSYYYVDIEHVAAVKSGETVTTPAIKGIVRNHIYDLTLNSISGPGIAVFNPDTQNIPTEPEDQNLFYLGARVNVLDWRIVSQGIDFGKE